MEQSFTLPYQQTIIEDIQKHYKIRKIFNCTWEKESFSIRLSQFYQKKLRHSCKKEKECGNGSFLIVVINDEHPLYERNKNITMHSLKNKYRRWTKGNYLVHGTDTKEEAEKNLKFLTGLSCDEFKKTYPDAWNGKEIEDITPPPLSLSMMEKIELWLYRHLRNLFI